MMRNHSRSAACWLSLILWSGSLGLPACDDDNHSNNSANPGDLTDGQIAQILLTANQREMLLGEVAAAKAMRSDVRQFATTLVSDHTAARQMLVTLMSSREIDSSSSNISRDLEEDTETTRNSLNSRTGSGFDQTYMHAQVTMHEDLLRLIDDELLPDSEDTELRAHVSTTRTDVQQHLQMAQDIVSAAEGIATAP